MQRRLADAQAITTIRIAGARYPRVVYGHERAPWVTSVPCHDCGARAGQLHVPGCDVEECPRCARQLLTCECADRDDDDEPDDPKARSG